MKKVSNILKAAFLIMALLFYGAMVGNALSAEITKTITFEWEQDAASLEVMINGGGWKLYDSPTAGGPYNPVLDTNGAQIFIAYDGVPGSTYTSAQEFTIVGDPGTKVTRYYVMSSINAATPPEESAMSEDALNPDGTTGVEIKIPMGKPFKVNVKVTATNP